MRKALSLLAIIGLLAVSGCTTSQCNVAQKAFTTAQIGHDAAVAAGVSTQIDRYWWAMGAAQAMMVFWCAPNGEVVP